MRLTYLDKGWIRSHQHLLNRFGSRNLEKKDMQKNILRKIKFTCCCREVVQKQTENEENVIEKGWYNHI